MSKSRQLSDAINSVDISESAPADAVTLDSSGNLLVGKTSTDGGSNDGLEVRSNGIAFLTRDGGTVAELNRRSSDGTIIDLRKDGTTVGSIGTEGGELTIGVGDTGIKFDDGANQVYPWNMSTNTAVDGARDLGRDSARWRNVILSGGIYFDNSAANYLDDYEEGTWTPTVSQGTVSLGSNNIYVKVGKLVTVWCQLSTFSNRTSSDQITISGLPFTGETGFCHGGVFGQYCDTDAQSVYMIGSGLSIRLVRNDSGAFHYVQYNDLNNSAASFYIGMTYKIA